MYLIKFSSLGWSYIMLVLLYENVKTKGVVTYIIRKSHIIPRRHGNATTSLLQWRTYSKNVCFREH